MSYCSRSHVNILSLKSCVVKWNKCSPLFVSWLFMVQRASGIWLCLSSSFSSSLAFQQGEYNSCRCPPVSVILTCSSSSASFYWWLSLSSYFQLNSQPNVSLSSRIIWKHLQWCDTFRFRYIPSFLVISRSQPDELLYWYWSTLEESDSWCWLFHHHQKVSFLDNRDINIPFTYR
jgi:hypothetical protein